VVQRRFLRGLPAARSFLEPQEKNQKKGATAWGFSWASVFLRAETALTCPRSSHTPPRVPHATHFPLHTPPTAQQPTPPRGCIRVLNFYFCLVYKRPHEGAVEAVACGAVVVFDVVWDVGGFVEGLDAFYGEIDFFCGE